MTNCRGERYQGGRMLGVRLCCAVKEDEKKKLLFERKGGEFCFSYALFLYFFGIAPKKYQKSLGDCRGDSCYFLSLGEKSSMRYSVQGVRVILMNRRLGALFIVRALDVSACFVLM
jgi:hypothetical protein